MENVVNFMKILIIFLALAGLSLSSFIHYKKRKKEKLICIRGYHCDDVINSKYSAILGIPLEIIGIFYYSTIILILAIYFFYPIVLVPNILILEKAISSVAFIFSVYLVSIQIFKLKQYCSWCLFSAAISTFILMSSLLL